MPISLRELPLPIQSVTDGSYAARDRELWQTCIPNVEFSRGGIATMVGAALVVVLSSLKIGAAASCPLLRGYFAAE